MAKPVKPDSPNQSGRGQARTRFARRAVVDTARALFVERGYVATTIETISEHSDVPSATVYRLFSSKLGILKALLDTSIAGDDQPLAVQGRPEVVSLFTESDPHKLLAGLAGVTTTINQRTNDVYRVLVSAAGSDPAAAELLDEIRQQRDQGQGQIARSLSPRPRTQARTTRTRRSRRDPRADVPRGLSPSRRRPRLDARPLPPVACDDAHATTHLNRRGTLTGADRSADIYAAIRRSMVRGTSARSAARTRSYLKVRGAKSPAALQMGCSGHPTLTSEDRSSRSLPRGMRGGDCGPYARRPTRRSCVLIQGRCSPRRLRMRRSQYPTTTRHRFVASVGKCSRNTCECVLAWTRLDLLDVLTKERHELAAQPRVQFEELRQGSLAVTVFDHDPIVAGHGATCQALALTPCARPLMREARREHQKAIPVTKANPSRPSSWPVTPRR